MAEGGGLLNRYRLVKAYRGFESLRLRQSTFVFGLPHRLDQVQLLLQPIDHAETMNVRRSLLSVPPGFHGAPREHRCDRLGPYEGGFVGARNEDETEIEVGQNAGKPVAPASICQ